MIETKTVEKYSSISIILAILIFIRCRPYYLWDYEDIIRPTCSILVTIIALTHVSTQKWTRIIFALIASSYVWASVFVDQSPIITLLNFLGFAAIPIMKRKLVISTFGAFRKILLIVLPISFVLYILTLLMPDLPHGVISYQNGPDLYRYYTYGFLVKGLATGTVPYLKFSAYFDEPGLLGTVLGIVLIAEHMNFKRKGNIILLIIGIFTLSFYFYVSLIVGYLFFSGKFSFKKAVLFVVIGVVLVNIPFIYDNVLYRFEYDADKGNFVGDNRNGWGLLEFFNSVIGTREFYTGYGSEFAEKYSGAASLFLVIIRHGLIFVILNISGFILLAFREIKEKIPLIMFIIFFILTLYQRPGLYATYTMFLYTALIYKFGDGLNFNKIRQKKKRYNKQIVVDTLDVNNDSKSIGVVQQSI